MKVTALIYPSDIYYAGVIPRKEGKQLTQLLEFIDLMDWNTLDAEVANILYGLLFVFLKKLL